MGVYITILLPHLPYKSGLTINLSKLDDKVGDERKLVFAGAVIVGSHMTPAVVIADFRSHDKFIGKPMRPSERVAGIHRLEAAPLPFQVGKDIVTNRQVILFRQLDLKVVQTIVRGRESLCGILRSWKRMNGIASVETRIRKAFRGW